MQFCEEVRKVAVTSTGLVENFYSKIIRKNEKININMLKKLKDCNVTILELTFFGGMPSGKDH